MGWMRHHAVIVSASYGDWIDKAHTKAVGLAEDVDVGGYGRLIVSDIVGPVVNGVSTFVVGPDGSKEGWDTSAAGELLRERFVAWLREQVYEDGSSPLDWAVVQYGDDYHQTAILDDSDADARKEEVSA